MRDSKTNSPEWELLISTSNEVDLGIITTILKNNNVTFITKDTAIGGYMKIYSGHSIYGTEIFVEKHEIGDARDLISNFLSDVDSDENRKND